MIKKYFSIKKTSKLNAHFAPSSASLFIRQCRLFLSTVATGKQSRRAARQNGPAYPRPHGVTTAGSSGVVGGRAPEAPLGAGHPRRSGERAPRMGPRRGAPVPAAPLPPPPHPHRHLPMRRASCCGVHAARVAAARRQDPPLPAEQMGADHFHLAAQEAYPDARRRRGAAGQPGSGDPILCVISWQVLISRPIRFTLGLRPLAVAAAEQNTDAARLLGDGRDTAVGGGAAARRRHHRCHCGFHPGVPHHGMPLCTSFPCCLRSDQTVQCHL